MKDDLQRVVEFELFSAGSLLMGYAVFLNFKPGIATVMDVVMYWFAGVLVFCLPWILFGKQFEKLRKPFFSKIKKYFYYGK